MNDIAIKVENLSKLYKLGTVGTGTIGDDITRWWAKVRGKEDPFAKIAVSNDRSQKANSKYVWSLKDIDFEVKRGEAVGIVGKNGAGKSTLLKVLSRITTPTTGSAKINGRVASLLEVGTGFNPNLTGRENIFMNGAILGMNRVEVRTKLEEIIEFSGVSGYIDTPVKRYSSGMFVRLAFAVAAHLEPEILIVDEVLAVGDIEFQRKCLGKMQEVNTTEGRTVLFVSHNMVAIQKFCTKGILLSNGRIVEQGPIPKVIDTYLQMGASANSNDLPPPTDPNTKGYATRLQIEDLNGNLLNEVPVGRPWQVRIKFKINTTTEHFIIALGLVNQNDVPINTTFSEPQTITPGDYEIIYNYKELMLATGRYNLYLGLSSYEKSFYSSNGTIHLHIAEVSDVTENNRIVRTTGSTGIILNPADITLKQLN